MATIEDIAAWATVGTALGTSGLAIATFVLAKKTGETARAAKDDLKQAVTQGETMVKQAEAMRDQAEAVRDQSKAAIDQLALLRDQAAEAERQSATAEAALHASIRPLLAPVPPGTMIELPPRFSEVVRASREHRTPQPERIDPSAVGFVRDGDELQAIVVRVQNVGQGAAIVLKATLTYVRDLTPSTWLHAERVLVAGPGAIVDLRFSQDHEPPGRSGAFKMLISSNEDLKVQIAYTDVSGDQETATDVWLARSENTLRIQGVSPRTEPRYLDLP